ncbi:extracellular solute-binding protein [Streptomyces sp. NPDC001130]
MAALTAFNLINFPDALLLLRAHELGLSTAGVVAAYAVYNLAYAALSYPAGALSDRLSRPLVFATGLVFFAVGYLGLGLIHAHAPWLVFVVLPLYGGFAACTDGVGKAWISTLVPDRQQGTAQGLYQGATGAAILLAGLWAGHQVPGMSGTYAFPWYLNTGPLFYNKALFGKAGLDPDKPPKTYGELFADALQMGRKSGGQVATLANVPTIEDFGRYGVTLMNRQGTAFAFNDAKGVELLTEYKKLYDAKALDPQALTATPESSGKKFLTGAVAMNPGSALDLDNFKKNAPSLYRNIGITDQITSTGHVNMYVMGVMVNSRTRHTPAAVAFAHFVTDARNQMSFAKKVAIFPSTAGSLNDPYFTKEDGTDETRVRIAAAKSLKNAVNYTPVLFSDQMKTALRNEVAEALQGKESPQQALDNAVNAADRLLRQG